MARSIPDWIGKTDDSDIPDRVKLRIINRQRPEPNALPICPECTRPMREGEGKPEYDHIKPLIDHGTHSEDNLRAIHPKCHRLKTAREAHQRAEARAAQRSAYIGKKSRWNTRGFDKAEPQHTASRPIQRRSERTEQ